MDGSKQARDAINVRRRPTVPSAASAAWLSVAVLLAGVPTASRAQTTAPSDSTAAGAIAPPRIHPGLTLYDPKGVVLGTVEHVLTGADGAPRQVLVRTGGVARVRSSLKALPAAGLTPRGTADATASLTREELQSLPDAAPPEPRPATP